ncbi:MAG TPA: regulatory protein RecX [Pyrinomonadaceae bacterium]|nr:regulatory protein RecX [Pyrinomonadaceae bacterium]
MWRRRSKPIDESERVIKDEQKAKQRTMDRAIRLLAAKPRSVAELRERLLEKSWTNSHIVGEVLLKLEEYKYLDDKQYAKDLATSKLRQKPQGKRKLKQTISQKKLDKDTVEEAIDHAFEKMPETELIQTAIEKRIRLNGIPDTREDLKKFYDHLMRQGFSYGLIREKLSEALRQISDEESS